MVVWGEGIEPAAVAMPRPCLKQVLWLAVSVGRSAGTALKGDAKLSGCYESCSVLARMKRVHESDQLFVNRSALQLGALEWFLKGCLSTA